MVLLNDFQVSKKKNEGKLYTDMKRYLLQICQEEKYQSAEIYIYGQSFLSVYYMPIHGHHYSFNQHSMKHLLCSRHSPKCCGE